MLTQTKNRVVTVYKVVKGRAQCDYCQLRGNVPISEIQVSFPSAKDSGVTHWLDCCPACIEGLKNGTLPFGPSGFPKRAGGVLLSEETGTPTKPTYGPRPRNSAFRCRDCKTQEYPLFGRGGRDRDFTYCEDCLLKRYPNGLSSAQATSDARRSLEEAREAVQGKES